MRITPFLLFAVCAFSYVPALADPPDSLSAQAAFKEAAGLMSKGKFKEAIPYLERVEVEYTNHPPVLWNLGIANASVNQHQAAIKVWLRYTNAEPKDWRSRAKLVQSYQALGDLKARDAAISELMAMRKRGDNETLNKEKEFCREQFEVAGERVFAFEYFEPQDPRKVFYRFSILNAAGKEAYYISLGSYKSTVDIARETGEIKGSEELYHLDKYDGQNHWTYGFFKSKPAYDAVRANIVEIMEGKKKPTSATLAPARK